VYLVTSNGPGGARHGHNVIQAAKRTTGPHIVRQGAYGSPKSRIVQHHMLVEEQLRASGLAYTMLRPTFFMQNVMMAAQTVASDGVIYMPLKDGRLGMIDARDIADAALAVLTGTGQEGKSYVLTGPRSISFDDVAAALSTAVGKPVKYVDVPLEAGKEAMMGMGLTEWTVDGYVELLAEFAANWGDRVSPSVQELTGRPGRSIEQFAQDFAAVFGPGLALAGAR
jgi:uncharacterized protein YbjT (DUF2867 family)